MADAWAIIGIGAPIYPDAKRWRGGAMSPDEKQMIVAGEFTQAQKDDIVANGGTILSQKDAAKLASDWKPDL